MWAVRGCPTLGDVQDQPIIDEALLERLERELADAADTLEQVERIVASELTGAESAAAIRGLLDDGRFAVQEPTDSDLVGDGDVDAVQQVDALAEDPRAADMVDVTAVEVAHPLEGGPETPLDLVDQPAVGHDDGFDIDPGAFFAAGTQLGEGTHDSIE